MSSSTSSQGVVDRVQSFVSENKRAILIGTAAALVAIGGVAYYASTSRGPGGEGDAEKGERKKDKKKTSKSSKKRKSVKDKDGPILEERSPKVADESEPGELYDVSVHSRCTDKWYSQKMHDLQLRRLLPCRLRYVTTSMFISHLIRAVGADKSCFVTEG